MNPERDTKILVATWLAVGIASAIPYAILSFGGFAEIIPLIFLLPPSLYLVYCLWKTPRTTKATIAKMIEVPAQCATEDVARRYEEIVLRVYRTLTWGLTACLAYPIVVGILYSPLWLLGLRGGITGAIYDARYGTAWFFALVILGFISVGVTLGKLCDVGDPLICRWRNIYTNKIAAIEAVLAAADPIRRKVSAMATVVTATIKQHCEG